MGIVIKGGNVVFSGQADISNQIHYSPQIPQTQDISGLLGDDEEVHIDSEKLEALKEGYINEGKRLAKELTERANAEAARVSESSQGVLMSARLEADKIIKESAEQKRVICERAEKDGYSEGLKKGFDDGYAQGLGKCGEALRELKKINELLLKEKAQLFQTYERQLFDMVFTVAQKITIDSLKQKDRAVIEKMLREAAKQFRGAKTLKVTLSALDLSEDVDVDTDNLKNVFASGTSVEFEVLKDAESGTLILDNGSEIVDASVSTQLRMIEELGRGKYRDKKSILEQETADEPTQLFELADAENEAVPELTLLPVHENDMDKPVHPENEADDEEYAAEALEDENEGKTENAAKKPASKRSRKPTNPLLTKMMDNLGENK